MVKRSQKLPMPVRRQLLKLGQDIRNARRLLDWVPSVKLDESVEETLDFFLKEAIESEALEISHAENRFAN